jgi:hypothetical protein
MILLLIHLTMSIKTPETCVPQAVARNEVSSYKSRPIPSKIRSRCSTDGSSSFKNSYLNSNLSTDMLDIDRLPNMHKRLGNTDNRNLSTLPTTVPRDPRRKMAWRKARAQHTRDHLLRQYSNDEKSDQQTGFTIHLDEMTLATMDPKRQRSSFVKDEELQCMLEDRIGTLHISELKYEENMTTHLDIEELALAGEANVLVTDEDQQGESDASDLTKFQ